MTNLNKSDEKFLVNPVSGEVQTEEAWEVDYENFEIKDEQTLDEFMSDLIEIEVDPDQEIFVVIDDEKTIEKMTVSSYAEKIGEAIDASESRLIEAGDNVGICAYDNLKDATEYLFQIIDSKDKGSTAEQYAEIYNAMHEANADMAVVVKLLDDAFCADIDSHDGREFINFTDGSFAQFDNCECFAHDGDCDDEE